MSRYQNEIPGRERKDLARKLNTLLREGKIPKERSDQVCNLLKSDEEKIEFMKDFKHFNELWQLLASRNRHDDAMNELLAADELEMLLENSFQANPTWQYSQRARLAVILNYLNAKTVFSVISAPSDKKVDAILSAISKSSYVNAEWGAEWAVIVRTQIVRDSIRSRILVAREVVEEIRPWAADFLTAVVGSP